MCTCMERQQPACVSSAISPPGYLSCLARAVRLTWLCLSVPVSLACVAPGWAPDPFSLALLTSQRSVVLSPLPPLAVPRLPRLPHLCLISALCPPSPSGAHSLPRIGDTGASLDHHHHHPSLVLELFVIHPTGQPWYPEPRLAHHLRLTAFLISRDTLRFSRALPDLTWPDQTRLAGSSASSVVDSQASFSRHQLRQQPFFFFSPALNISPSANPTLDVDCMPGRSSISGLSCLPSVPRS